MDQVNEENHDNAITVERRDELIVSLKTKNPTLRLAHFLVPPNSDLDTQTLADPTLETPTPISDPAALSVSFSGWLFPQRRWSLWVDRMYVRHLATWKAAGISGPILDSKSRLPKGEDLAIQMAKLWCPETNTFVLSCGEATVSLEDMMVCFGYSVLGSPVFERIRPEEADEMKAKTEELAAGRLAIVRTKAKKATHSRWMDHFYEGESGVEHEAFLVLWLTRFVFPGCPKDSVTKQFFPLAVRLARGARVALAPAVLAGIYKDLTLLRNRVVEAALPFGERGELNKLEVWSPMLYVTIWAIHRIWPKREKAKRTKKGQGLRRPDNIELEDEIFPGVAFCWRPYASQSRGFYRDSGGWLPIRELDDECEAFARCLRASDLVGVDPSAGSLFVEKYSPHRVARQFGYDQDVPSGVIRRFGSTNYVEAWTCYDKPFECEDMYFPSKSFRPGVTPKYLEWWEGSEVAQEADKDKEYDSDGPPPGFPAKTSKNKEPIHDAEMHTEVFDGMRKQAREEMKKDMEYDADGPPPGFPAKTAKSKEPIHDVEMHTGVFDGMRKQAREDCSNSEPARNYINNSNNGVFDVIRNGEEARGGILSRLFSSNNDVHIGNFVGVGNRVEARGESSNSRDSNNNDVRSGVFVGIGNRETRGESSNSRAYNNDNEHSGVCVDMGNREEARVESSNLRAYNNNNVHREVLDGVGNREETRGESSDSPAYTNNNALKEFFLRMRNRIETRGESSNSRDPSNNNVHSGAFVGVGNREEKRVENSNLRACNNNNVHGGVFFGTGNREETGGERSNSRAYDNNNVHREVGYIVETRGESSNLRAYKNNNVHNEVFLGMGNRVETRGENSNSRAYSNNNVDSGVFVGRGNREETGGERSNSRAYNNNNVQREMGNIEETRGEGSNLRAYNNNNAHRGVFDGMGNREKTRGESSNPRASNNNNYVDNAHGGVFDGTRKRARGETRGESSIIDSGEDNEKRVLVKFSDGSTWAPKFTLEKVMVPSGGGGRVEYLDEATRFNFVNSYFNILTKGSSGPKVTFELSEPKKP